MAGSARKPTRIFWRLIVDRCEQGITEFVPGCYAIAANGDSYAYRCKGLICGHR